MTYTTQQLQAMSDDELNQDLAALIAGEDWYKHGELSDCCSFFTIHNAIGEPYFLDVIDYCNNPNDIMPLAFERGIKLDCVACPAGSGFVYYAKSYDGELQSDYDSACRAIACLLLMMED